MKEHEGHQPIDKLDTSNPPKFNYPQTNKDKKVIITMLIEADIETLMIC